jgi:hypothetical protein
MLSMSEIPRYEKCFRRAFLSRPGFWIRGQFNQHKSSLPKISRLVRRSRASVVFMDCCQPKYFGWQVTNDNVIQLVNFVLIRLERNSLSLDIRRYCRHGWDFSSFFELHAKLVSSFCGCLMDGQ